MIFVVCGTQKFPLNRLLIALDELVESGKIQEEIIAQIGNSDYHPKHYQWVDFYEGVEFEEKIKECSILFTHSGVGTILTGKEYKKPVLVFPRSQKHGEHVDDHQWQIARMFAKRQYILICEDEKDIERKLDACRSFDFQELVQGENIMVEIVREYLGKNL